jgi:hypothetical protein
MVYYCDDGVVVLDLGLETGYEKSENCSWSSSQAGTEKIDIDN